MTTVLIVDDEPTVSKSTAVLLQLYGFDVETHEDADTIIARIRELRPDVVIQDVRMPGLDAPTLLAEIRTDPTLQAMPIVIWSADLERTRWIDHGASATIGKPFDPSDLRRLIEKLTTHPSEVSENDADRDRG